MIVVLTMTHWMMLILTSLFFLGLCITCIIEKERRAAWISGGLFTVDLLFWLWIILNLDQFIFINITVTFAVLLFAFISAVGFFPSSPPARDIANAILYDERDNMFSRNNLKHSPNLMAQYYNQHPEFKSIDQQIHQKPDFGQPGQVFHDPYTSPVYLAAFEVLERSIPVSCGTPATEKSSIDPALFCQTIVDLCKFYGACDASFLQLKPHHFYSHKGRHLHNWGKTIDQSHKTAISIVVPMRVNMIKQAPTSCVIQESAQKYVEAAKISNILAAYIRSFGYEARAHNDANYNVLSVPIAVESGLGELGRLGILMHRDHGPCVRLATVTTELELPDSPPKKPMFMEHFCSLCKKCADNCPSGSITHGDEPVSRNIRHWSIAQERCFSYWKTIGSDCGLCISVCPYTKPDSLIHCLVRFYISRNPVNQKIALLMDDLLYGRKKKPGKTNPDRIFLT